MEKTKRITSRVRRVGEPPMREEGDPWEPEEASQRAYPDGSVPTECWAMNRAFARKTRARHPQPQKSER